MHAFIFILARIACANVCAEAQGIAFVTPAQARISVEEDAPGADDSAAEHRRRHTFVAATVAGGVGHAGLETVLPVFGKRRIGGGEQAQ